MAWEQYNFTNEFQDAILACMIRYPDEFWSFGDIMRPQYFNGVDAAEVAFALKDYVEEFGKYPNFSTLMNWVYTKFERSNADKASQLVDYVQKLIELDHSDWEGVRKLMIKFAKERSLFAALRKIHAASMEGKSETIDPVKEVEEALIVGEDIRKLGINAKKDFEEVIRKVNETGYGVQTGFNELDKIWKKGWCPGWLIVPLAPPKAFKTTFCINLALNMAGSKVGADVLYYALEIDEELAAMRLYYNLSGMSEDNVLEQGLEKFIEACREGITTKLTGNLWFKSFPSKTATIFDVEQHAKHLCASQGLSPRAIVIDYAETVKPSLVGKNVPDARQQADIYVAARALGSKLGACVIMPDRCNKETVGRKVPNMTSFQGSFEKAGAVDAAIGICFTEEEALQNKVRYFIFLNRHGRKLVQFEGRVDPERMKMTIDKEIEYHPDPEEGDDLGPKPKRNSAAKRKASTQKIIEEMS